MSQRNYWLDLFTGRTWEEFVRAGAAVSGFRENRSKTVEKVKPGDYLLCYLTGISRFIGILEVVKPLFKDNQPIWKADIFPCRLGVKPIIVLSPETAVPVLNLRDKLSIFKNSKSPSYWTGFVRGSPSRWKSEDGEEVVAAVEAAKQHPVKRPVDPNKLGHRPRALTSQVGPVVVPGADDQKEELTAPKEATIHTEIQWLLSKLGSDMGLDVWVARNDRNRSVGEHKFTNLNSLKGDLPLQFDEATNRTIELIDVLWLQKHTIVAAFEIESTTSIYSGLLRLSDLISMQPNLKIPLFIVAPDERRKKVFEEVNRPTFSKLSPPMYQMCRFIAFSTLQSKLAQMEDFVRYVRPEFLDELAESCELEVM